MAYRNQHDFSGGDFRSAGRTWSDELSKDRDSSRLDNAYLAQPSCTALQLALVDLLDSWQIRPVGVVGHSSGEIAAAYAAKAISFEAAMVLAFYRGTAATKLMYDYPATKGAMLAIGGQMLEVDGLVKLHGISGVVRACYNSPASFTMSGDQHAIEKLDKAASGTGLFSRKLKTEIAYHSHHMSLVADYYRSCIEGITTSTGDQVSFHSSLLGQRTDGSFLGPDYWVNNLTSPVLFSAALESMCSTEKPDILLEVGPHMALKGPIRETLLHMKPSVSPPPEYLPCLVRFEDSVASMLGMTARLIVKGADLNLSAINFPTKDPRQPIVLTDLETYAWDHSKSHWYESRIAQGYRLRKGTRNDILGILAADSNDVEPRWRNIIKIEDVPWLEHHKVQGNIVYPMSGFIAMAVQAMKVRAESRDLRIERYSMKEVHSSRPLVVPTDGHVETMLTLRPYNESAVASSDKWDEFRILSFTTSDQGWSEHCRGLISAESTATLYTKQELVAQITGICTSEVKPAGLYDMLGKMGVEYGSLFAGVESLAVGIDCATGTFRVPDTAATMPYHFETEHVIHPATLDMCFQFIWPSVVGPSLNLKALYVPTSIKAMSISSQMPKIPCTKVSVFGQRTSSRATSKKMAASLVLKQDDNNGSANAIEIDDLTLTRIAEEDIWQRESTLAFKLELKPDIDFINAEQLRALPPTLSAISEEALEEPLALEQASLVYFQKALSLVSPSQIDEKQPYLHKFYEWMTRVCELGQESSILLKSRHSPKKASDGDFLERVAGLYGSRSALTCSMGRSLPAILRGELDPLSVLLEGTLLSDYYSTQDCITRSYQHACQYVDLIAHQNPALKVLEIGAGTGGATFPILETLGGYDGKQPRLLSYDYTDISSGFFDAAEERFAPWNAFLHYRILDLEKDLGEQGFGGESYDLIVAANVLHATSLLTLTMTNVWKLLKPGGKLILIEETIPAIRRFPFAALPGWWLSQEEERRDGPLISETQWEKLLRDTGFTGLDICLQDYPGDPAHTSSTMLSTAEARQDLGDLGEVLFASSDGTEEEPAIAFEHSFRNLAKLRSSGVCPIESAVAQELRSTTCIFIDDPENPFLAAMTDARLDQVKRLFQAKAVIWVTGAAPQNSNGPGTSLINGLTRSVRSENAATKVVTLHCGGVDKTKLMQLLSQIYRKMQSSASAEVDFEYMEHDGMLAVPRACECSEVENTIVKYGRLPQPETQPFIQPYRLLTLKHGTTGMLSELYFDDQNITLSGAVDDDKIRIDIKAMGVNFKDVVVALGQVDGYLGHDCSGIVSAIGSKVTNVSVGDRVCALARETFSTVLECNALSATRIPDDMSFTDAASIPAVFCTAYYSLINVARLQAGESVLIHAAAGGVGQAAIIIAQMVGAEIYVTVGSEVKKEHLIVTYGIPRNHILNSRTSAFGQEIRELTHQRGVDVVLNSLGGELLRTTWDTLASYGRFVELGKLDIERNSRLDMATFSKSTTFASFDLEMLREDKPTVVHEIMLDIMGMYSRKKLKMITPINVLPIDALESALNDMQRGKSMGKTVIESLPGQEVQAMPAVTNHPSIRSDATYLVTGGMGGLGRSMTKWLVQQGATSIALLSRSGHTSVNAKTMKDEYLSTGVNVSVLQCDVADEDQVRTVIEHCSKFMPPIRGIIHGAMVLHDKLFDNITISDYSAILAPKVQGAWNLHTHAPPLDFFVSLASAAGILGTRGQSVYAGTSTFLGAFARWRQAQGLPANTLYLGAVAEVGYVAERSDRQGAISSTYGDKGLTEREFLAFIRASIENQHSIPEIYTSLALGSGTSSSIYWAGDAKFALLRRQALASQSTAPVPADDQAPRSLAQLLAGVESLEEAQATVAGKLKAKLCSLLMVPEEDIDETKAVVTYGLDSLVAVEYRNWIVKEAGAGIQLLDLMTSRSFGDLTALVTKRSSIIDGKKFAKANGVE
ncbi:MAG: hypothetical protein LQ337_005421 [Flavoplaca oasis]|nr:MAG: hypothetical protein LQ337_005421 [Flavoplaca oasis]